MPVSFPTSVPSYPDTAGSEFLGTAGGGLGISRILDDYGLDISALATKMGTGSATPSAGKVLRASGSGTSTWGAVDLTADVTGTLPVANGGTGITALGAGVATFLGTPSSANLASAVTGETGSGALVFGTSPTIATPTLTTPTIASFASATHDHSNAAGGGTLTHTALPAGVVVQVVGEPFTAAATGTTTIPFDDTIPQNTEGTEFMTATITPKSATNILTVRAVALFGNSAAVTTSMALFQDTTADALAATAEYDGTTNVAIMLSLEHEKVAGTTSAITFKIRAGGSGAGTVTFGGTATNRVFGAITKCFLVIIETKA